jgi:hypothetical protein
VTVEPNRPHTAFQAAVHYTSMHTDNVPPLVLRLLTLVGRDGRYYLVPTRPLVRRIEYVALASSDSPPKGWTKPTTPWGLLLDAAGAGASLQLDDRELYAAALSVAISDFGDDLYGAQTVVRQLGVLIAAKYGMRVKSFAELPGVDNALVEETIAEADAAIAAMTKKTAVSAPAAISVEVDQGGRSDRAAFSTTPPNGRPSRR